MLNIKIVTIPHEEQRYETVGDWFYTKEGLTIHVSDMKEWRKEILIAIHELVEVTLCRDRGIPQEVVDAFDKDFEKNRQPDDDSEPGDSLGAPYRKEHFFATNIERAICHELGLNWQEYEKTVNSL
jgi:hypothetical protein